MLKPHLIRLFGAGFFLLAAMPAMATNYAISGNVIGHAAPYTVAEDDNLYAVARRFDLGIVELLAANPGVDAWQPKPGTRITLTTSHVLPDAPHEGIVLNLSELRLFFYPGNGTVVTFPIGIGQEGWQTPLGKTFIKEKREHPEWIPPASIREEKPELPEVVPAGPDNPLGEYALYLGWPRFLMHGTNRPAGIGKRSSHGCIRLYPEDIGELFRLAEIDTPVTVIDTPYKLGWQDGVLYLEVTPTQRQADAIADYEVPAATDYPEIYEAVKEKAGDRPINWYAVEDAVLKRNGIPVPVTLPPR